MQTRSEARKAYWATVPKEERSARARKAAKAKAAKMTTKQKRDHALMMLSSRNGKKYK